MNTGKKHISDIIISYLKGTISEKDNAVLQEWIAKSSDNKALFERLCLKDSYIVKAQQYKTFEAQNRYNNIRKAVSRKNTVRKIYTYSSIAAAILLPLVLLFLFIAKPKPEEVQIAQLNELIPGKPTAILHTSEGKILQLGEEEFRLKEQGGVNLENKDNKLVYAKDSTVNSADVKLQYSKVEVPRGGEYNMVLSDGTKVWLNSESTIKYPVRFLSKKRVVKISGEVYFDVAKDNNRPFIVLADETKIEVLGTKFNVRTYQEEDYIATTLVEGKVRTWADKENVSVLKPSQQYLYNKKTRKTEIRKVDVNQYIGWVDGLFIFDKQSLEDILNIISKWYDVEIFFEDNSLRDIIFSGRLKRYEDAGKLLTVFEEMEDVSFKTNKKVIYVRRK